MFDTLVESSKRGRRDITGTMLCMFTSTTLQAVMVVGAVYATMEAPWVEPPTLRDSIILLPPDPRPQERPEETSVVAAVSPLPIGFQTPDLPTEIVLGIPPIDSDVVFDPRNYTGKGIEGGVFDGFEDAADTIRALTRLYETGVVDEVPERISCPSLAYPRMMRQANIEGRVLLQFVIGAGGHVEAETIEVLSSSHRAFERPAREMITRCLFRPGRVRTSPVRVLVQLPAVFDLTGNRP